MDELCALTPAINALATQVSQDESTGLSGFLPFAIIFIIATFIGAVVRNWLSNRD